MAYEPLAYLNQDSNSLLDMTNFGKPQSFLDTDNLFADGLPQEEGLMEGFGMKEGVGAGLGALKALLSYQGLRAGKKQNKQSHALSMANLGNQAKLTNSQLFDRQTQRVAQDQSGTQMSVADYMEKFGVSGTV